MALTPSQVRDIADLHSLGWRGTKIADALGIPSYVAQSWIRRLETDGWTCQINYTTCQACGALIVHPARGNRRRFCATAACQRAKWQANMDRAVSRGQRSPQPAAKNCVQCGEMFQPPNRLTLYCSDVCRKRAARERQQQRA